jgi:ankyrin
MKGQTMLMRASAHGLTSTVAKLLALGADVAAKDAASSTAVELAKDKQTIEILKRGGATMPEIPHAKNNDLLMSYARKGCAGGVLIALQAGAQVNHLEYDYDDEDGDNCEYTRTALHIAVSEGHLPVVQALVSAGADINARSWHGHTPLSLLKRNIQSRKEYPHSYGSSEGKYFSNLLYILTLYRK